MSEQPLERLLEERYGSLDLKEALLGCDEFAPFPRIGDREAWSALNPDSAQRWIGLAERELGFGWPALKAELFVEVKRTGEFTGFIFPYWERRRILGTLVLAECAENHGRFMPQIINGIYVLCEETSWMPPHMNGRLKRTDPAETMPAAEDHEVELFGAETAALLVWTRYLLLERLNAVSGRIAERIEREVRDRLIVPYLERDDYWWMGFVPSRVNNWNPWCNGNALMALLTLECDPAVREAGVRKIMRSLDVYLRTYPADGCCDEGPMYWGRSGGSLFDCLELLSAASRGVIDVYDAPIVRDIGSYFAKAHIDGTYYVNYADGDAIVRGDPDVVYGYGKAIGDEALMRLGASLPPGHIGQYDWFPLYRHIRSLFQERERAELAAEAGPAYPLHSWMGHSQVMTARELAGEPRGLFLAAKGGHNLESHNHNDVGSFIVYADGHPVFIDLGTEEYVAQAFGPRRFELWYLQSAYHNLPTVRGVMQRDGRAYGAADAAGTLHDGVSTLSLDIAGAYPPEAAIAGWRRTCRLIRVQDGHGGTGAVEIFDAYELRDIAGAHEPASEPDAAIRNFTGGREVALTLMTPHAPRELGSGRFAIAYASGKRAVAEYDGAQWELRSERIAITDKRLGGNWGEAVYRVLLKRRDNALSGTNLLRITLDADPAARM